jgi:hypothetical protein
LSLSYNNHLNEFDIEGHIVTAQYASFTGINDITAAVNSFNLKQNYPNPFNPATNIGYQIPSGGHVTIRVYDMLGREVKTLINEYKPAGSHNVDFNSGSLSSGTYIYRIVTGDYTASRKMVLVK